MEKIKLKIPGHIEREKIISILVMNGYKVWQEVKEIPCACNEIFVCFEYGTSPTPMDRLRRP